MKAYIEEEEDKGRFFKKRTFSRKSHLSNIIIFNSIIKNHAYLIRGIYFAKYYGGGGGWLAGEKNENEELGEKKGKKKGGK